MLKELRVGDLCRVNGLPYWVLMIISKEMLHGSWRWIGETGIWGLYMKEPSTVDYISLSFSKKTDGLRSVEIEVYGHRDVNECNHESYLWLRTLLSEGEQKGDASMPDEVLVNSCEG